MKQRSIAVLVLLSLVLGMGFSLVVTRRASAACYDSSKNEVPCDSKKKVVPPTPIPQQPAAGPAATVPVAVQSIVIATPNPDQLKAMCANLPAPAGSAATGPGGGVGSTGPTGAGGNGGFTGPTTRGFTGPVTYGIGLGGLLLGVLIGLLVPAVMRRVNGDGRSFTGGVFAPTGDKWDKDRASAGGPEDKQAEAGALFIKHGGSGIVAPDQKAIGGGGGPADKQGEAGALFDAFHKAAPAGFAKQGDAGMQDLHRSGEAGYEEIAKSGQANMGDASVRPGGGQAGMQDLHNSANQFHKGMDDPHLSGNNDFNGDGNITGGV